MIFFKEKIAFVYFFIYSIERKIGRLFFRIGKESKNQFIAFIYLIFLVLLGILSVFSPVLIVFLSFVILVLFSERISNRTRCILGFLLLTSFSVILSSRERFLDPSDDMIYYYSFYNNISSSFSNWEGMVFTDFGFYFFLKFLKMVFPFSFSVDFFLFLFSFISSFLFYLWLERYALNQFKWRYRAAILGISLFYFGYFMSTQAVRQMIAIPIVLMAFSDKNFLKSFLLLVIASLIHSSSIIIFFIFLISKMELRKSVIIIISSFLIFKLLEPFLLNFLTSGILPNASIIKSIVSYLTWKLQPDHIDFFYSLLRISFFSAFGFIVFYKKSLTLYRNIYFLFLLLYLITFQYPYVPFRLAMPTFFVMVGFLKVVSVYRMINTYRIFTLLVSINFLRMHFFYTLQGPPSFRLFYSFPSYSVEPFYYFSKIFGF